MKSDAMLLIISGLVAVYFSCLIKGIAETLPDYQKVALIFLLYSCIVMGYCMRGIMDSEPEHPIYKKCDGDIKD